MCLQSKTASQQGLTAAQVSSVRVVTEDALLDEEQDERRHLVREVTTSSFIKVFNSSFITEVKSDSLARSRLSLLC